MLVTWCLSYQISKSRHSQHPYDWLIPFPFSFFSISNSARVLFNEGKSWGTGNSQMLREGASGSAASWDALNISQGRVWFQSIWQGVCEPQMTSLCSLRAQIIYSKKWPSNLPRAIDRKAFLPPTLATGTTTFLWCIWRHNLDHVVTGSVQYKEICYNGAIRYKKLRV